ncbi:hypothetical protein ACJ73_09928 [Blastomyces percursus]|uniref:Sucrase/ferredoxin-like family protein n=1 Tax=Blastomyces percursus TaxID=1658174 RepID=A0A1J9Q1K2_9EURO|nr:hypothetical protein ACJ73_09928 [Blastomyces percursus]
MLRSLLSYAYQIPFPFTSTSTPEANSIGKNTDLFPIVDTAVDGPDCDQDCADCTIEFPARFRVNSGRELYGSVKPFVKHVLVATGKADWAPRVEGERGSLMEGFNKGGFQPRRGKMMVSASNLSIDPEHNNSATNGDQGLGQEKATTVLILPSFTFVDRVTVSRIPELMERFIEPSPEPGAETQQDQDPTVSSTTEVEVEAEAATEAKPNRQTPHPTHPSPHKLTTRPCHRDHLILLCSHNRRDARCGMSAPLIRRELERHLRPLGLYRDEDDSRPGGVGILYVSHVGGHKFAANVLIYRREAEQLIWLARVRPADCEGIVKQTVLKGKVVHAEQLRGGFDRRRGVASW